MLQYIFVKEITLMSDLTPNINNIYIYIYYLYIYCPNLIIKIKLIIFQVIYVYDQILKIAIM
jgi:hypothetical protein